jgi:hypothetical protein
VTVTFSSIVNSAGLLTFQSLQRREHRRVLRDSIETRLGKNQSQSQSQSNTSRPAISRSSTLNTTIDDKDEELVDYSDAEKARQRLNDRANNTSASTINGAATFGSAGEAPVKIDEEIIREQRFLRRRGS